MTKRNVNKTFLLESHQIDYYQRWLLFNNEDNRSPTIPLHGIVKLSYIFSFHCVFYWETTSGRNCILCILTWETAVPYRYTCSRDMHIHYNRCVFIGSACITQLLKKWLQIEHHQGLAGVCRRHYSRPRSRAGMLWLLSGEGPSRTLCNPTAGYRNAGMVWLSASKSSSEKAKHDWLRIQ